MFLFSLKVLLWLKKMFTFVANDGELWQVKKKLNCCGKLFQLSKWTKIKSCKNSSNCVQCGS